MIRAAALLLASAVLAAGCERVERREIKMANPAHEELMKLSPGYQRIAMYTSIRDGGYRNHCQRVENAGYQQEHVNMRMWVAECPVNQRRYAVFIAPNGDVEVRNCDDAEQLNLPRCNPLPPPVPDPAFPSDKDGPANKSEPRPNSAKAP